VRLTDIVNTLTAYRDLQAGLAGRSVAAANKGFEASVESGLLPDAGAQDAAAVEDGGGDSVELSGYRGTAEEDGSDDSLGAIVEGFIRQRQTYAFTLPGVAGISSPISVTWEVEQAYHVIQFVPAGQMVNQTA